MRVCVCVCAFCLNDIKVRELHAVNQFNPINSVNPINPIAQLLLFWKHWASLREGPVWWFWRVGVVMNWSVTSNFDSWMSFVRQSENPEQVNVVLIPMPPSSGADPGVSLLQVSLSHSMEFHLSEEEPAGGKRRIERRRRRRRRRRRKVEYCTVKDGENQSRKWYKFALESTRTQLFFRLSNLLNGNWLLTRYLRNKPNKKKERKKERKKETRKEISKYKRMYKTSRATRLLNFLGLQASISRSDIWNEVQERCGQTLRHYPSSLSNNPPASNESESTTMAGQSSTKNPNQPISQSNPKANE